MTPILVDDRIGSKYLATLIEKEDERAEVELTRLEYGDVAISVNGPDDSEMLVGIEVKRIEDLLSSLSTGRLVAHQIPGLLDMYDMCILLVQGMYRPDPETGVLQILKNTRTGKRTWIAAKNGEYRWMWKDVNTRLWSIYAQTLMMGKPVTILQTANSRETALIILSIASWGSKKWGQHRSLKAMNKMTSVRLTTYKHKQESGIGRLLPPTKQEEIVAHLVGPSKALRVLDHFGSIHNLVNADESEWLGIKGIGKLTTKEVMNVLRRQ